VETLAHWGLSRQKQTNNVISSGRKVCCAVGTHF